MIGVLRYIGVNTLSLFQAIGLAQSFLFAAIAGVNQVMKRPRLLLQQIFELGVRSLSNVVIAGLFVGMVLCLQGYHYMSHYGVGGSLGVFVATTLTRELGPVLTGLLFAGRVGSSLAAELALMKSTQQINALEMMAVEPRSRIVAPRLLAGLIVLPLLSLIFVLIGVIGAYAVTIGILHQDGGAFWASMQGEVRFFADIVSGMAKSLVFALIVTWISLYQGYYACSGAQGMAKATTRGVVLSSLAILGLDFLLTAFMYMEH